MLLDVKLKIKGRKEIDEIILKELRDMWSERKQAIRKIIADEIDETIEKNKALFMPHRKPNGGENIVGFLGIGDKGRPDKRAMENAYALLLTTGASSNLSVLFQGRQHRFGRVKYTIKLNEFLNHSRITKYKTWVKGQVKYVNWMKQFIFGIATPDYGYVSRGDKLFNWRVSRTGLGHMVDLTKVKIPVSQFVFNGVGLDSTFGVLYKKIEGKLLSKDVTTRIEQLMSRR